MTNTLAMGNTSVSSQFGSNDSTKTIKKNKHYTFSEDLLYRALKVQLESWPFPRQYGQKNNGVGHMTIEPSDKLLSVLES